MNRHPSFMTMTHLSDALAAIKHKATKNVVNAEEADLYNSVKTFLSDLTGIYIPELRDNNDYDVYSHNCPIWISNRIIRTFQRDFNGVDPRTKEEREAWEKHIEEENELFDKLDYEDYIAFEKEV